MGSLIAAYMLRYGWGWSFVVPGAFIAICGACPRVGQPPAAPWRMQLPTPKF